MYPVSLEVSWLGTSPTGWQRFSPGGMWPLGLLAAMPIWLVADRAHNMYFRWAFCLAVGLLIPWFKEMSRGWLNEVSKAIAKYSYGIYLAHMPVMNLVFGGMQTMPVFVRWVLLAGLSAFVPVVLFKLVERPMIRVGRRIAERFHPPAGVEWRGKGSLNEPVARASSAGV